MVFLLLKMIAWCVSYLNKSKQQRTIYVHGIIGIPLQITNCNIHWFTSGVSVGTYWYIFFYVFR